VPSRRKPAPDNAVQEHRLHAGLTQAELAERVGVSRQTVVAVESGGYAPSVYLALALAEHLGSTVEELFATTPAPAAPSPSGGPRDR